MPIQFRCTGCNQKLAISRRKAGKVVSCPACSADIQVPTLEAAEAAGQLVDSPKPAADPSPPYREVAPPRQEEAPPRPPSPPPVPNESPATEPPIDDEAPLFGEVAAGVFDDLDEPDEDVAADAENDRAASPAPDAPPLPPPIDLISAPSDIVRPPDIDQPSVRRWEEESEEDEEEFHIGRRETDESGLDMTPMVDVTFLLLIFFMITAAFSVQKSMETEAPEPDDEGAAQMPSMDDLADDSVIVEIDENDSIYVDDKQVGSIPELRDALELKFASEKKTEMIIEPHPQAKHGTVVQATDAGIDVGMQRIRRVTRKGN